MKIALAQLNPTIGNLNGNLKKLKLRLTETSRAGVDLIILPELFLCGYPPRDLLDRSFFIEQCETTLKKLEKLSLLHPKTAILVGTITRCQLPHGKKLHNSAVLIENGKTLFTQHKSLLPAYDVFDESRYFEPAHEILSCPFRDEVLGISICEDAWNRADSPLPHLYAQNPLAQLSKTGATLLINLSASPYYLGKEQLRREILAQQSQQLKLPLLMVNQVGGNDELIFDGDSLALNYAGEIAGRAIQFSEELLFIDTDQLKSSSSGGKNLRRLKSGPKTSSLAASTPPLEPIAQLEKALVLG
ncbi:MAG: NAD+ synthase, partial [Deltaproteobacteria bacterium]|nr:NAD+ synthase [Candidatus Tharpella sp.]